MSNKDLLKQAIAEAKTIREAAIANAKEALEETLTPHLKDMLAAKLQEMEEKEDAEVMDENIYEAEEEEVETEEGEEAEEEAGEEEGNEEEELEIEDMSVEDLKDLIRDIVAQETGHDESEEEIPGEETPEGDMVSMDGDSEEIDINELLAELDEYGSTTMSEPSDSAARGSMELEKMVKALADKTGKSYDTISNFLFGGKKATPAEFEEGVEKPMKEYTSNTMSEPSDSAARGSEELEKTVKALADKTGKTYDAISNFLFGGKKATPAEFEEGVQTDLNEALQAVKILKNQLQEVNLLNAKLLYVNKVFKSNNLSEGQKVNVIAAFDKAETVKEVKLVFETVSKNVVAKPTTIKEHRSFASKATGNAQTTAPKEILSEVSDQVARWQKLAGIIKS